MPPYNDWGGLSVVLGLVISAILGTTLLARHVEAKPTIECR